MGLLDLKKKLYNEKATLTLLSGLLLMTPQWVVGQQLQDDSRALINRILTQRNKIEEFMNKRFNVEVHEITGIVNGAIHNYSHQESVIIPEGEEHKKSSFRKSKRKSAYHPQVVETTDSTIIVHFSAENYKTFDKPTLFKAQIIDRDWISEMIKLAKENVSTISFQECLPQTLNVASTIANDDKSISYEEFNSFGSELKTLKLFLYQAQQQLYSKTNENALTKAELSKVLKEIQVLLNSTRVTVVQLKTDMVSLDIPPSSSNQYCQNISQAELFPYRFSQETYLSQIDGLSLSTEKP